MNENKWTLIILAPMRKSRKWYSARGQVGWSRSGSHARAFLVYDIRIRSLLVSTQDAINSAVELALQSWQQVYDELQDHLPPREYYDTLLSNDDSLPASIDCFWFIDRLGDIMPQLIHTKEEWDEWLRYHLCNDVEQSKDWEIKGPLGEIEAHMQMISGLYDDFNALERRAETIISAIFNLTSVKETRESRLLGENVKLLTYATIFFLPLSFCTEDVLTTQSLWSINGMFDTGIRGFAIVTCVIALSTYAVITLLFSSPARRVPQKFGQRMWQGIKRVAKRPKMFTKKSEKQKQKVEVDEEMLDPEKTA
ncbi:uncharacterized protein PAC_04561 [Phialocephala subalpina]|uniref:Uncharacterized protein n=1 Tax=Phialocephala subalpina TaxID=576137 RepID=A0A1L7WPH0_9HELO|nr:uncharacterized protein PAC_04561 [Phialocephala subalpina]